MSKNVTIALMLSLVISVRVVPKAESGDDSMTTRLTLESIGDVGMAIHRSYQLTGFDHLKQLSATKSNNSTVALQSYSDSTFPFLAARLNGRECWHITLDSVYLTKGRDVSSGEIDEQPKRVDIYLDSARGCLIKAVITAYGEDSTGLPPERSAEITAKDMSPGESYLGLVDQQVPTDLLDALRQPIRAAADAHQVIVYLVNYSNSTIQNRPFWILIMRGVVPEAKIGVGRELNRKDETRKIGRNRLGVDALTGKLRFVVTEPPYSKFIQEEK